MKESSSHETSARLLKGGFISMLNSILVIVFSTAYTILVARLLGSYGYGIVATCTALLSILSGIAGLGIPFAIAKYISKYAALKDWGSTKAVLRVAFKYIVILGLAFSVLLLLLAEWIATSLYHNPGLVNIFRIIALALPPALLLSGILSAFQGFQKISYYMFAQSSSVVLAVPIAVALMIMGYFATGALLGTAIGTVLACIFSIILLSRVLPKRSSKTRAGGVSRDILSFSIPMWLLGIGSLILWWYTTLLLGYVTSMQNVGYYSSSLGLTMFLLFIPVAIAVPLFPLISELWTLKDKKRLAVTFRTSIKLVFTILIPLAAGVAVFSDFALTLLYGRDFIAGGGVLRILAIALFFMSIMRINDAILGGIGKPGINAKMYWAATVLAVALITPLAWFYGITGAAVGFLVAHIFIACLGIFFVKKLAGLSYPLSAFKVPLLAVAVMLAVVIPLRYVVVNALQAILVGILGILIYIFTFLKLGGIKREEISLLEHISADIGKPRAFAGVIKFLKKFTKQ